jgi:GR25 family glycosyltransferase involved in LPS biosynthesis
MTPDSQSLATGQDRNRLRYKVKVINLDRDAERLARVTGWYRSLSVSLERYRAILGSEVREAERFFALRMERSTSDGTLGCALSHVGIWAQVAAGPDEYALVIEDDARPLANPPEDVAELGCPADFDVFYVNARMTPRSLRKSRDKAEVLTLFDAMMLRDPDQRGHGTDGYFLSRKGAARLLGLIHQDRILGHIDLQMLACGITSEEFERLVAQNERYASLHRVRMRRTSQDTCRMYVSTSPLVMQSDEGVSARTGKTKSYALPQR